MYMLIGVRGIWLIGVRGIWLTGGRVIMADRSEGRGTGVYADKSEG